MKKPYLISILIIAVLLLGVAYFLFTYEPKISTSSQSNPNLPQYNQPQITESPSSSKPDAKGWKIYRNPGLGFEIKYPKDFEPTIEMNGNPNNLVIFGDCSKIDNCFEVNLGEKDPYMGVTSGYLDAKVIEKNLQIAKQDAYKAVSEGYADMGAKTRPYVEYGVRVSGGIYHIIFHGDMSISSTEQQILESFSILK